jgi:hypothetical protein
MPLFFFVTEAGLLFLQTCFLPEYLIVSHSAAFCNHYAFADLWPWIGLGFVFSADEGDGVCTWFGWVLQAPKKEKAAPSSKPAKSSGGGGKQKKKVCVVAGPSLEAVHFLSWCSYFLE